MTFLRIASALGLASVLAFSAGTAHAIAYPNPTKAQQKALVKTVTARIQRSAEYKTAVKGGAKLNVSFTAGQATIGPDRSGVMPKINATLLSPAGQYGMANNVERTYNVTENAKGAFTARASGKWQQLMTLAPRQ